MSSIGMIVFVGSKPRTSDKIVVSVECATLSILPFVSWTVGALLQVSGLDITIGLLSELGCVFIEA